MKAGRVIPLLSGLALAGVAALVAASPPKPASQTPTAQCLVPDAAKCVSEGYIESFCGRKHAAMCKPHVEAAMEDFYKNSSLGRSAPLTKMFPPGKTRIPADLDQGKYFAYKPALKAVATAHTDIGKVYRKTGDPLRPYLGLDMSKVAPIDRFGSVDPATAAAYHREPSWDANGDTVTSCAEYAYERSYDVARFVDAASACRGDRDCVFAVAYLGATPGVAGRTLKDTADRSLPSIPLATGVFPKNDLFAFGDRFVRANGFKPLPETPTILALEAALRTGKTWYELDNCTGKNCNARKFRDEWAWHTRLRADTAQVSDAEFEEYEARRAKFRALLEQWQAAVDKEADMLNQRTVTKVDLPFDLQTHDPHERLNLENQMLEHGHQQLQQVKKAFGNKILEKSLAEAMKQVVGGWVGGSPSVAGVLASPSAPKARPSSPMTPTQDDGPKPTQGGSQPLSQCLRSTGWGLEINDMGKVSCRIGEFLRAEWDRKLAGERSCLDLGNPHCDWALEMFEAGILDGIPLLDRQLADNRRCQAWQDGATFPATSVTEVDTRLAANEAAFAEVWPLVKEYDRGSTDAGRKFGKQWVGGDYVGDPDWFATGYDYSLGWNVAAQSKSANGNVCTLGGSIHADVGFDAWIVGSKVEVVDGSVRGESNHGGNNTVRYKAHLEMFDQTLFSTANEPNDWKVAQSFNSDPGSGFGISLPTLRPRFDIYVGVPISGQMWGELLFGSGLSMSGSTSGCDNPKFSISAGYMPFFGAYGLGQVGVGIAGVVSAGIRASLTLVTIGVPLDLSMRLETKQGQQVLRFDSQLSLMLSTLSGRVSLYIEFLMFDEEWELFRWQGIGPAKIPLMTPLTVEVPLAGMKQQ